MTVLQTTSAQDSWRTTSSPHREPRDTWWTGGSEVRGKKNAGGVTNSVRSLINPPMSGRLIFAVSNSRQTSAGSQKLSALKPRRSLLAAVRRRSPGWKVASSMLNPAIIAGVKAASAMLICLRSATRSVASGASASYPAPYEMHPSCSSPVRLISFSQTPRLLVPPARLTRVRTCPCPCGWPAQRNTPSDL